VWVCGVCVVCVCVCVVWCECMCVCVCVVFEVWCGVWCVFAQIYLCCGGRDLAIGYELVEENE